MSAPARELARRVSGTDEVLLLWHPDSDRVELSVRDLTTGAGLEIEVPPGRAMDAFHHPYAYAAVSRTRTTWAEPRGQSSTAASTAPRNRRRPSGVPSAEETNRLGEPRNVLASIHPRSPASDTKTGWPGRNVTGSRARLTTRNLAEGAATAGGSERLAFCSPS